MFEKDLPGKNTAGHSAESKIGTLPLETCETMNNSWGFNLQDPKYKSTKNLVQYLVKAAGNNANFLLNIGPMPNGKIQPEFVKTLGEMGKWMDKNGETLYNTRGGIVKQKNWGVSTQKGNTIYIHMLNADDDNLLITEIKQKVKSIKVFGTNTALKFKQDDFGLAIELPKQLDEIDTILVVE